MPAVGVAGSTFTVEVGASDFSCQVTTGTISFADTVIRTRTLCGVNFVQTDQNCTMTINFLYDGNTGLYDALATAATAGTSLAVDVSAATGAWTSTAMWIDSLDVNYDAANVATCTVSLQGTATYA